MSKVYKVSNKKVTKAEFLRYKMAQEIIIGLRFDGYVQTQLGKVEVE